MPSLAIALIGLGRMGANHAKVIASAPDVTLAAVLDTRAEARAAATSLAPTAAVYSSVEELAADDTVDAWLIASSTPSHPALVRAAVAADVHVLCEKPLALDPGDGEALGAEAATAGKILQVGFWRRFSPPWVAMQRAVVGGAIGNPLMLRLAQWDQDPPPAQFCDPAVSGGLAIDCGVHEFDLAEWLTGQRVVRVMGRHLPIVDAAVGAAGDVDNMLAVLELESGAVATVDLTRNARFGEDVRSEVLGSDGAVLVEMFPTARARIGDRNGLRTIDGTEVGAGDQAGLAGQLRAFAQAVAGEPGDIPGAAASNRAVRIARAVEQAITEDRWVMVD